MDLAEPAVGGFRVGGVADDVPVAQLLPDLPVDPFEVLPVGDVERRPAGLIRELLQNPLAVRRFLARPSAGAAAGPAGGAAGRAARDGDGERDPDGDAPRPPAPAVAASVLPLVGLGIGVADAIHGGLGALGGRHRVGQGDHAAEIHAVRDDHHGLLAGGGGQDFVRRQVDGVVEDGAAGIRREVQPFLRQADALEGRFQLR